MESCAFLQIGKDMFFERIIAFSIGPHTKGEETTYICPL
jgi:hypothetical protein